MYKLYSCYDIAKKLNVSVSIVKSHLSKCCFTPKQYNPQKYSDYQVDILARKIKESAERGKACGDCRMERGTDK
jgi:transposase